MTNQCNYLPMVERNENWGVKENCAPPCRKSAQRVTVEAANKQRKKRSAKQQERSGNPEKKKGEPDPRTALTPKQEPPGGAATKNKTGGFREGKNIGAATKVENSQSSHQ